MFLSTLPPFLPTVCELNASLKLGEYIAKCQCKPCEYTGVPDLRWKVLSLSSIQKMVDLVLEQIPESMILYPMLQV